MFLVRPDLKERGAFQGLTVDRENKAHRGFRDHPDSWAVQEKEDYRVNQAKTVTQASRDHRDLRATLDATVTPEYRDLRVSLGPLENGDMLDPLDLLDSRVCPERPAYPDPPVKKASPVSPVQSDHRACPDHGEREASKENGARLASLARRGIREILAHRVLMGRRVPKVNEELKVTLVPSVQWVYRDHEA